MIGCWTSCDAVIGWGFWGVLSKLTVLVILKFGGKLNGNRLCLIIGGALYTLNGNGLLLGKELLNDCVNIGRGLGSDWPWMSLGSENTGISTGSRSCLKIILARTLTGLTISLLELKQFIKAAEEKCGKILCDDIYPSFEGVKYVPL